MEGKILRQYINYLFSIGFLSGSNISEFITLYQKISDNYQTSEQDSFTEYIVKEKMSLCFIEYLNSLTDEKKVKLSNSLFSTFLETRVNSLSNSLISMLKIYRKQLIFPKFHKWKKNFAFSSFLSSTIMSAQTSPTSQRVRMYQTHQQSLKPKSPVRSQSKSKPNSLETTQYLKEQEELSHCTFQPNIKDTFSYYNSKVNRYNNINNLSHSSKDSNTISSVHNRLYTDYRRILDRREIRALEKNNKEAMASTFKPVLIASSPKKNYNNFIDRLKSFEDKKSEKIDKIISEVESDYNEKCSFSPNITLSQKSGKRSTLNKSLSRSFSSDKIPVYERLYEYNKIQKQNLIKRQNEINNEIRVMAASPSMRNIQDNNISLIPTTVDYKKIEELYKDYKKVKKKIIQKQNDIDIEQGLTFKPELYTNEKYYDRINPNFHEREKEFMNEKQKFLENCIQMNEEHLNKQKWGHGKYSNKEKEEITNNIIERLYRRGLEKYTERKGKKLNEKEQNEEKVNSYYGNTYSNKEGNINTYSVSQLPIAYGNGEQQNSPSGCVDSIDNSNNTN